MAVTRPALSATIFGARGSLPNPSVQTQRYGGATTCLGVATPDGVPLVIDGGSGVFDLGLDFLSQRTTPQEVHLFFTHTHWDHVLGLPFFFPFYDHLWTVHIYSLGERRASVRDIFTGVYARRYFPVRFEHLDAKIEFHELHFEDRVAIGDTTVTCCRVNHPGYALGFRIDHSDRSLFFASDAAPFHDILFGDRFHLREREKDPVVLDQMAALQRQMESTAKGVDLVFHDANYTDAEYEKLFHFGHASMTQAYELALGCGARRVVFWHHDRSRTDEEVDALIAPYQDRGPADDLIVEPAKQGTTYHLEIGSKQITTSHRG